MPHRREPLEKLFLISIFDTWYCDLGLITDENNSNFFAG